MQVNSLTQKHSIAQKSSLNVNVSLSDEEVPEEEDNRKWQEREE